MAWYDVGSVAVTNNSTTVTGTGTDFISGAQVGEALYINDDLYEIAVINSSTQLTLADPYLGSTASGLSYKIIPTQSLVADLSAGVADLIADFADVRDYAGNGKFNDGTEASPAITFTQDQNNGLYRIGSDNWGLVAGGDKQLEIKTTGVKLDDNKKITFGASDDLQIFHDGSHSIINDTGTGHLKLQGTDVRIQSSNGNENFIVADANGAVRLYNDDNQKLQTTSTGVDVTGTVTADGLTVDGATEMTGDRAGGSVGGTTLIKGYYTNGHNHFNIGSMYSTGANLLGYGVESSKSAPYSFISTLSNYSAPRSAIISGEDVEMLTASAQTTAVGSPVTMSKRMKLFNNGDVHLYEDTGTTAKFVWDSSAETLAIGATSTRGVGEKLYLKDGRLVIDGVNTSVNTTALSIGLDAIINEASFVAGATSGASTHMTFTTTSGGVEGERMRIDSSGNVGIGTASPSAKLDVAGGVNVGDTYGLRWGTGNERIVGVNTGNSLRFVTNNSERLRINSAGDMLLFGVGRALSFETTNGGQSNTIRTVNDYDMELYCGRGSTSKFTLGTDTLKFETSGSERARIDSSGNLLVGRTATWNFSSAVTGGAGIDSTGYGYFSRVTGSATPLYLQRSDTSGVLCEMYKGTNNAGKIGVSSGGDLYFSSSQSSGKGIYLNTNGILPSTNVGAPTDSGADLGQSSVRWKDLYLSGGVYLGGTGSVNKLDDYETGTFTVGTDGDATGALSDEDSYYVKVGNLVTCQIVFDVSSNFTSNIISGLPYVVSDLVGTSSVGQNSAVLCNTKASEPIFATAFEGSSVIKLYEGDATTNHNPNTTQNVYRIMLSYFTTA